MLSLLTGENHEMSKCGSDCISAFRSIPFNSIPLNWICCWLRCFSAYKWHIKWAVHLPLATDLINNDGYIFVFAYFIWFHFISTFSFTCCASVVVISLINWTQLIANHASFAIKWVPLLKWLDVWHLIALLGLLSKHIIHVYVRCLLQFLSWMLSNVLFHRCNVHRVMFS